MGAMLATYTIFPLWIHFSTIFQPIHSDHFLIFNWDGNVYTWIPGFSFKSVVMILLWKRLSSKEKACTKWLGPWKDTDYYEKKSFQLRVAKDTHWKKCGTKMAPVWNDSKGSPLFRQRLYKWECNIFFMGHRKCLLIHLAEPYSMQTAACLGGVFITWPGGASTQDYMKCYYDMVNITSD